MAWAERYKNCKCSRCKPIRIGVALDGAKPCRCCERTLPLDHFPAFPAVSPNLFPDGRWNWCQECFDNHAKLRAAGKLGGTIYEIRTAVRRLTLGVKL